MPRRRLAVALLLPDPIATEVDGLRRALGDGSLDKVAPHITLVPPVNVRIEDLGAAFALLRTAAAATECFTVTIGPPATFEPINPVVYLAVGGDEVDALRDRVFVEPLTRTLTNPFVPHVTIADECAPERIEAALAALADFQAEVTFDGVFLLEDRAPGPRRWNPVADARFESPAIVGRGGYELELTRSSLADPEVAAVLEESVVPTGSYVVVAARHDGRVVGALRASVSEAEASVVSCAADDDVARLLLSRL